MNQEKPALLRRAKLLIAGIASVCCSLPLIVSLYDRANPLTLANESLAYRFFLSERILGGEGASAWIWQGFLTSAVQNSLLEFINRVHFVRADDLEYRTLLFSYSYSLLVTSGTVLVLFCGARLNSIRLESMALLSLAAVGPLLLTGTAGLYYLTLPDYYQLNLLLLLLVLLFFQIWWSGPIMPGSGRVTLFLAGLLLGALVSNKITMAVIGVVPFVPLICRRFTSITGLAIDLSAIITGALVGFLFVVWWLYLFDFRAVGPFLREWLSGLKTSGGEAPSHIASYRQYLIGYGYGAIILFYFAALLLAAIPQQLQRRALLVQYFTWLGLFGAGFTWALFVHMRPAGTTLFEAATTVLVLGCMALCTISSRSLRVCAILLSLCGASVKVATEFPLRQNLATLRESGPLAKELWYLHHRLINFARGRPIIVVLPENEYGYGGVPEFLLKGTANFPTWLIGPNGRKILDRYVAGLQFRHEYGGPSPRDAFPAGSIVFWVDKKELPPIAEKYEQLRMLLSLPSAVQQTWRVPTQGGKPDLTAHAVIVPAS